MGWLDDALDFELFNAKDIWKKIKKDPERLLLGAVDPYSSKAWSAITGNNYEPLVDQMGGAYGGHTFSTLGNQLGGVYGRAGDAGINVGPGASMQDLAHIISAMYAGGYGNSQVGSNAFNFRPNMQVNPNTQAERDRQIKAAQDLLEAILLAQSQSSQVKYG